MTIRGLKIMGKQELGNGGSEGGRAPQRLHLTLSEGGVGRCTVSAGILGHLSPSLDLHAREKQNTEGVCRVDWRYVARRCRGPTTTTRNVHFETGHHRSLEEQFATPSTSAMGGQFRETMPTPHVPG